MSLLLGAQPGIPGMLDTLAATTNIVGAWSACRALKNSTRSAGALIVRSNEAGTQTTIHFGGASAGGIVNVASLLAVCVGGQKEGVIQWLDQSGNGNHQAPKSGAADSVICSTAGALTFPVACVRGRITLPMIGFGAGNQAGSTGSNPNMLTATPMPVSLPASAKHFMLAVLTPTSGSGDIHGTVGAYLHTGDADPNQAATSAVDVKANGSNTSGQYTQVSNNANVAQGSITAGSLGLLGSLFDGANGTVYGNRTPGTPVACTNVLGAGGTYSIGSVNEAPTTGPWCGAIAELIVGSFTNSAAAFLAGDWAAMQNSMRAFYGTP